MTLRHSLRVLAVLSLAGLVACDALAAPTGRSGGQGASQRGSHSGHSGHHGRFANRPRFFIGIPLFAPLFFYSPLLPYYYPTAPLYFELSPNETPQPGYWYYCAGSNAYYPAVSECPEGWQQVAPRPPS